MRGRYALLLIATFAASLIAASPGVPTTPKAEDVGDVEPSGCSGFTRRSRSISRPRDVSGAVTLVARRGRIVALRSAGPRRHRLEEADDEGLDLPARVHVEADHGRRRDDDDRRGQGSPHRSRVGVHPRVQDDESRRREGDDGQAGADAGVRPRRPAACAAGIRSGAGRSRDHRDGSADAHVRPHERRRQRHRAGRGSRRAARSDTLANYIPKLAQTPLDFQPGTLWRYSGLYGFDVLAPHRRDRVGSAVRSVSSAAALHAARHEGHGLRADAGAHGARGDASISARPTARSRRRRMRIS